jgi:hypothetical protein
MKYVDILTINTKPSQSAPGRPLRKRLPASDWTDPSIPCRRGPTAPPWWRRWWDSCVGVDSTFNTIPTTGIPRGGSFSFPPEPIAVKLLILVGLGNLTVPPGKYTHLLIICHLSASIFFAVHSCSSRGLFVKSTRSGMLTCMSAKSAKTYLTKLPLQQNDAKPVVICDPAPPLYIPST